MNEATTASFIARHLHDDVHQLALSHTASPDVDIRYALQQIQGWQIASHKLPLWAETAGIIYPPHISMEQCSSEQAARYKAQILQPCPDGTMADLTGGLGVDASFMGRHFRSITFVERDTHLCDLARHNLPLLGIRHLDVINTTAEQALTTLPHQHLIYLDPARRDSFGRKTILIEDCTPDVMSIYDILLDKADCVMVKLSPMLDLTTVTRNMPHTSHLHVLSIMGECKEIIAVVTPQLVSVPQLHAVNITGGDIQQFDYTGEGLTPEGIATSQVDDLAEGCYLYEPNASIMKAGLFRQVASHFGIHTLHPNTHLYVSPHFIGNFPGRKFIIARVFTLGKADLQQLRHLGKANLCLRNFPSTVDVMRRKLHIAEGGSTYLFAVTVGSSNKKLIICCDKIG